MKILILGGDGMLGHRLLAELAPRHEARVTLRRPLADYERFGRFHRGNAYDGVDVRNPAAVAGVLDAFRPAAVVNAAGVVKQRADARLDVLSMEVNAIFPHLLARVCRAAGARLVHLSTDCVFSGAKGGYTESDRPDPPDVYGLSKLLGEVERAGALTLRTSMIGPELDRRHGLLEWFLAQRAGGGPIKGWRRAVFSGFTTAELSRVIEMILVRHPGAEGLYHAGADAISKFDLLTALNERLGPAVGIEAADAPVCDRSLDSSRFRAAFGYAPPPWNAMLAELAADLAAA